MSYARGGLLAYANFAAAKAKGRNIVSSQFSFGQDDLDYIARHYIYLDHDQTFTGSAGLSYAFAQGTKLGGSMIYGSGLRRDDDVNSIPNGAKLSPYAQFNLTASQHLAGPNLDIRFDVINVLDHKYEIRDGTGVGVGAPQYGPSRLLRRRVEGVLRNPPRHGEGDQRSWWRGQAASDSFCALPLRQSCGLPPPRTGEDFLTDPVFPHPLGHALVQRRRQRPVAGGLGGHAQMRLGDRAPVQCPGSLRIDRQRGIEIGERGRSSFRRRWMKARLSRKLGSLGIAWTAALQSPSALSRSLSASIRDQHRPFCALLRRESSRCAGHPQIILRDRRIEGVRPRIEPRHLQPHRVLARQLPIQQVEIGDRPRRIAPRSRNSARISRACVSVGSSVSVVFRSSIASTGRCWSR